MKSLGKIPECQEQDCNKMAVRISIYDKKTPLCYYHNIETLKCISILKDYSKKKIKKILKKGQKVYIKNLKEKIKNERKTRIN